MVDSLNIFFFNRFFLNRFLILNFQNKSGEVELATLFFVTENL